MKKEKLLQYMNEYSLDACIISNPKSIEYITTFECDPHERLLFYVLKKDGSQTLLCPALEENSAKNATKGITIVPYLDTENGFKKLEEITGSFDKVGVEKEHLTVKRFEIIQDTFDVKEFNDISQVIKNLRKYKGPEEIAKLQEAAKLADICIQIAKDNLRVGITELELKAIIENEIQKYGVSKMSFDTIVLFGANAANPHGVSSNNKLKNDEYVLLDLGCFYKGYASDITRTLAFGNPSKHHNNIYNLVLKANTEAIKAVKPGVSFASLDKIARDIITEAGYGPYFNHRLGHGLGIECHEYPDVSATTYDLLEEGMVFTIEPGIYLPDDIGVRIEDDIVVTKDGYISLTKYEK